MFYIQQIQKDDCGFACLKMLLATINKDKNYLFLPQKEDHGMYSFNDLVEEAYYYRVTLSPFRTSEKLNMSHLPVLPFIARLTLKNGSKHAVLVTKVRMKRVTYLDPNKGKMTLSVSRFVDIWDGTGLMIDRYEKWKCPKNFTEPISLGKKILLGIIQLISGVFAVLGVAFIREDIPTYVPLMCLSCAIILEVVMRILSYRFMKKLDNYFFGSEIVPRNNFKEYLRRFEEYKRLSLSSPMNYILLVIFSIGLITIVLLNDYRNAMIAGVPLFLAVIEAIFIWPILKKRKQVVEEVEDDIDLSTDYIDFQRRVKNLHHAAYRYSYLEVASRYIYAAIIIVVVYLTMKICNINSFPYIIFYTCISLSLFKALREIFSFEERINEFNKVKVKISNSINSRE